MLKNKMFSNLSFQFILSTHFQAMAMGQDYSRCRACKFTCSIKYLLNVNEIYKDSLSLLLYVRYYARHKGQFLPPRSSQSNRGEKQDNFKQYIYSKCHGIAQYMTVGIPSVRSSAVSLISERDLARGRCSILVQ